MFARAILVMNKIEGTPILKLAMVKRFEIPCKPKVRSKSIRKLLEKYSKTIPKLFEKYLKTIPKVFENY